jgi:hypothetical protein
VEPLQPRFLGRTKMVFELNAQIIELGPSEAAPCCPLCEQELSLHQPDENLPSQLLATCDYCSAWYSLIDLNDEGSEVFMVELPGRSVAERISERMRTAS